MRQFKNESEVLKSLDEEMEPSASLRNITHEDEEKDYLNLTHHQFNRSYEKSVRAAQ